ncbi:MAG TPA: MlaD family protein, partial [Rhodopila sp.]|nr:MlaD family protein [Rhodopila sp.]
RAVVFGGIAFDTPDDPQIVEESQANQPFKLFQSKDAADDATFKRSLPFVANFTGSVTGLAAGSPVTLRGQKIGEVTSVSLIYDKAADNVLVPVHFTLEPERIAKLDLPSDGDLDERLSGLVRRGLRVKLQSGNILTGQKQLAIDIYPHAGAGELGKQGDTYVIPVLGGGSDDIATAAASLMNRLNSIPFESIGKNLDQTLAGANTLVNDKDLEQSVSELKTTLASAHVLVNNLNQGVTPAMKRLPVIASELQSTVQRTDKLIGSLQTGYGGDSGFSRDATRLMMQLTDAARSIRVLADLLSRHPEALIRGRTDQGVQ